jgi:two-component system, OmpR family, response regulator
MRLLLIEDSYDLVSIIKKDLEKAGFSVDVAYDGIEGEYMGNEGIYEFVILDLGLPKRNGITVLQNWRANRNNVPVLILTARDAWHEKVDGFRAGADDYLAKPFHTEELLARINAVIHRSHQNPSGNNLQIGNLILDEDRQRVTLKTGVIHELTGTQFKLLRFFMLHPGQVLSKAILLEQIYDLDVENDSNVIEVYISHLRRIIGKQCIETRRGQGYVFKELAE